MKFYDEKWNMVADINCDAIMKLHFMLSEKNIPHTFDSHRGCKGFHLCYPDFENRKCSVVLTDHSYGWRRGLLEIMGLLKDDECEDEVTGYLTCEDVYNRIVADWEKRKS